MGSAKKIYRTISSMKTGLIMLVLIALVSALGSALLPDAFFNTVIFKGLLLLLFLNMILCTLNRLIRFFKIGLNKSRGRLSRQIGIILLHAGIVFILAGGSLYSCWGQSAQVSIEKGHTVDLSGVIATGKPFSLRLEDFNIKFNKDGSPSQYYSNVTILEDNKVKRKATISVNHPFKYQGIKAYQESFGYLAKVKSVNNAGHEANKLLGEGEMLKISGTKRVVKIYRYFPDFDPAGGMEQTSMKPDNPRVVYSVYENNKLLGVGAAKFGEKIELDKNIYFTSTGVEPYTVLRVKSDPGLPLALAGGLMFMAGVSLALLAAPMKKAGSEDKEA
ncbi:MAG TPA: cytochrome c biogenesis protein ResB [Syntrophomonadaceae bacterium]|nr:cytochrome c biogenesis protein ResB [Syntrophomonadaceae bacterium]